MLGLFKKKKQEITIKAPFDGDVIKLEAVEDEVFSKGFVGVGCAMKPSSSKTYAPIEGQIVQIFKTNHAIAMTNTTGIELLVHLGLDTVHLNGKGFERLIEIGMDVSEKDAIIESDWSYIQSQGKLTTTPIVVTNYNDFEIIDVKLGKVKKGDTIMTVIKKGQ